MRVYLAGPIFRTFDDEVIDWRDTTASALMDRGHTAVDPKKRDYRGREDEFVAEIVETDKAELESCDFVIANCWQVSAGTSMEILHAWLAHIPVVAVLSRRARVSPWISYHATVVRSLSEALKQLEKAA